MAFTAVFGVASGAYAAKIVKSQFDFGIRLFSIFIYSIPIFFGFGFSLSLGCG
jgi:ABC-type dipeptide/oligopeptide/nickel transport system permease component